MTTVRTVCPTRNLSRRQLAVTNSKSSYVLAAQLADTAAYPDDLAYDMEDPYHYFRTHVLQGRRYLILGGGDHKTGHGDPKQAFRALEAYLRKHFEVASIDYRWSAQFFEPADGLPYIGKLPDG